MGARKRMTYQEATSFLQNAGFVFEWFGENPEGYFFCAVGSAFGQTLKEPTRHRARLVKRAMRELVCVKDFEFKPLRTPAQHALHGGIRCPICGGNDFDMAELRLEADGAYQSCDCADCGAIWKDEYRMSRYVELEVR